MRPSRLHSTALLACISMAMLGSALFASACGGSVHGDSSPTLADDAGSDALADADDDDEDEPRRDGGSRPDRPGDYVDPECPDEPVEPPYVECDALAPPPGGCAAGEACSPFVLYPQSECGTETYGTRCIPAGTGRQGSPCGDGESYCDAGFVCVISGAGIQCVKLCELDRIGSCQNGLVCEPIDVPGFGGCL